MTRLHSHQQPTTTTTPTVTVAARKLANKQRRKAGREVRQSPYGSMPSFLALTQCMISLPQRHEERKEQIKALDSDRRARQHERDGQPQGKRRDNGVRAFAGRSFEYHRTVGALHARATDLITADAEDSGYHEEAHDTEEEEVRFVEEQATSGAMLLAMAQPPKTRRRHRCPPVMTDGEIFEVVEIDGRLVALDEDGWEILPDENAEVYLLYSDIVRGTVR